MKVERVSYDLITPSAARGILEAIYWKPQMRWVVDRIHVLAPIGFTHVRRNEIDCKIPVKGPAGVGGAMKRRSGRLGISVEQHRQQRASLILTDVCYGLEAHVEVLVAASGVRAPEAKHLEMFKRRAAKGQCFHRPYLGCREFPAGFELVESFPACPDSLKGQRDMGYMLHEIDFVPDRTGSIVESHEGRRLRAEPRFFRALMKDGVVEVPTLAATRLQKGC